VGGLRGDWFEGDFYRALARMRDRHAEAFSRLEVHLVGEDAPRGELARQPGLDAVLKGRGFLPRDRLPEILKEADAFLLLLPISNVHRGCVPQKLYTYLVSERPVLAVVPEGQAAEFMRRARVGLIRSPDDPDGVADALAEMVHLKHAGRLAELTAGADTAFVQGLSKTVLGDRLMKVLLPGPADGG
jgi:glycosyltransferase involved in cell wall biosynthesis